MQNTDRRHEHLNKSIGLFFSEVIFGFHRLNFFLHKMKVLLFVLLSVESILTRDIHFDYFVFTQQWPPAVCIEGQKTGHQCSIPTNVKGWVIHGLWPSRNMNRGPFFCNNSDTFDENKLKPIEEELRLYWPNLFSDSPDLSFWKHEWKKHGTCSLSDKLIPDEFTYFKTALNLYKKYNITSILGNSGIIPNTYTSYKSDDFCNAVENSLNTVPVVTCIYDKISTHHYLLQIEICVDKDFNTIDCPERSSGHHSNKYTLYYKTKQDDSCARCSSNKGIWYPPITSYNVNHG